MKTIALIVPAYKTEKYIVSCLKSIQTQEIPDGWKLDLRIGVDGCENTKNELLKLGIDFYYSFENVGAYIMRNSLIASGKADAYCLFDADDIMMPGFIKKCLQEIEKGFSFVMPAKINTDEKLNYVRVNISDGGAMLFKDSVLDEIGGFAPVLVAADSDFYHRAKKTGFGISELKESLYYRRRHIGSLTKSKDTGMGSEYRKKVWAEMTQRRESGQFFYDSVTVELEKIVANKKKKKNVLPVYILIRTSKRPRYFVRMMDSVNRQTYENIITIVHTDDPEDDYFYGDMIIRGERIGNYSPDGQKFNAPYNLYCNRLLEAIPEGDGWYYFLDDDDILMADDVIERFVKNSKEDCINIAKVSRYGFIYPKNWKTDTRLHTESFFLHTKHKDKAKWWGNRGGDHDYSNKICGQIPQNWIENLIAAQPQEGKGWGNRLDRGMSAQRIQEMPPVAVMFLKRVRTPADCRGWEGEIKKITYKRALELERRGKVIINPNASQVEEKKQELLAKSNKIITYVFPEVEQLENV